MVQLKLTLPSELNEEIRENARKEGYSSAQNFLVFAYNFWKRERERLEGS